ncbi:MAG: glycosyltransferase family 2 protein [Candidatus Aenigmarchaeota archaeon]|nr:glycosyltransferase family 2 protein [Candidatus Aenigmarchaeota archaeon]
MKPQKPDYSIIICTKNEEKGIKKVLGSIPKDILKKSEVIVVDSSTDLTPKIAKDCGAKVIFEKGKGKGRAMKTGVKNSKGEILIFLDGDGTDPPEYISKLLEKLKNNNLVIGCRKSEENKKFNLMEAISFIPRLLFRLLKFEIFDPLGGYRAIRKKDFEKLNLKSNDFTIETEMNLKSIKNDFKVGQINTPLLPRCGGIKESKFIWDVKSWIKITKMVLKFKVASKSHKQCI